MKEGKREIKTHSKSYKSKKSSNKTSTGFTDSVLIFLKGILMGIAEIIPSISGSTIALFLGIYERLINALHTFLPHNIVKYFKKSKSKRRKFLDYFDFKFLLVLILGMLVSIFVFSHVLEFLLRDYRIFFLTFFIGFIGVSTFLCGKSYLGKGNWGFNLAGLFLGISLVFLSPQDLLGEDFISVMTAGIIAIVFGLLPGISGSFMLLIIGKYEFVINAVSNLNYRVLFAFLVGIAIGVVLLVRVIKHFLDNHKRGVLSFFFAFVIGSLGVLGKEVIENFSKSNFLFVLVWFVIGTLCALYLKKFLYSK